MPFFRSAPSCVPSYRHREQLNAITSFVDASMVYGSSSSLASALRNSSCRLGSMTLNSQHSDQDLGYMPFLPRLQAHLDPCGPRNSSSSRASDRSSHQGNTTSCFQAGERVNVPEVKLVLDSFFLSFTDCAVRRWWAHIQALTLNHWVELGAIDKLPFK